jgi:hypothetical protein
VGEFGDRQSVQTESQNVVCFFGSFDDLLQFVDDVTVQVGEENAVDVQGVLAGEPGSDEQREDVFERS